MPFTFLKVFVTSVFSRSLAKPSRICVPYTVTSISWLKRRGETLATEVGNASQGQSFQMTKGHETIEMVALQIERSEASSER